VVIASIFTINIAIETDDGLVSDDYYKEGLGIHKDADSTTLAKTLGIAAAVRLDPETGAIAVTFEKPLPGQSDVLSLEVTHPTRPNQDQVVQLTPSDGLVYLGRLDPLGPARWKLELRPDDRSWRIAGRLALPQTPTTRLD
ncbi:MAG: FixH family protein, partial [Chromatiaceae bacterium]